MPTGKLGGGLARAFPTQPRLLTVKPARAPRAVLAQHPRTRGLPHGPGWQGPSGGNSQKPRSRAAPSAPPPWPALHSRTRRAAGAWQRQTRKVNGSGHGVGGRQEGLPRAAPALPPPLQGAPQLGGREARGAPPRASHVPWTSFWRVKRAPMTRFNGLPRATAGFEHSHTNAPKGSVAVRTSVTAPNRSPGTSSGIRRGAFPQRTRKVRGR